MKYILTLLAAAALSAAPLIAQDCPCPPEGEKKCEKVVREIKIKVEISDEDVAAAIEAIKNGSLDEMIKTLESVPGMDEMVANLKKLKAVDTTDKAAVKKLLEECGIKLAGKELEDCEDCEDGEDIDETVIEGGGEMVIMLPDGTTVKLGLDENGKPKKEDLDKLSEEQRKQIEELLKQVEEAKEECEGAEGEIEELEGVELPENMKPEDLEALKKQLEEMMKKIAEKTK